MDEPLPPPKVLVVHVRLTDDIDRDMKRLDTAMEILTKEPGHDAVNLVFHREQEEIHLTFPQHKTRYSSQLHAALQDLLGNDSVEIKDI